VADRTGRAQEIRLDQGGAKATPEGRRGEGGASPSTARGNGGEFKMDRGEFAYGYLDARIQSALLLRRLKQCDTMSILGSDPADP